MVKKVLALTVILILAAQGAAFAADSKGEIVARDAVYGAGVGAFLGISIWLINTDDNVLPYIGVGLTSGTVLGLAYGLTVDAQGLATIEKDGVKYAFPTIEMERSGEDWKIKTALLNVKF